MEYLIVKVLPNKASPVQECDARNDQQNYKSRGTKNSWQYLSAHFICTYCQ